MIKRFCCDQMEENLRCQCPDHHDPFDCPDHLIAYSERFDEYGIIVHDGGKSYVLIEYCPWCGAKLPKSKRDRWFDILEGMGYVDNLLFREDIPQEYTTDAWWKKAKEK